MEKFYVNVEKERREEFYKTLKNCFSNYYREVEFSDAYISVNNFTLSDFRGNICYLETRKRTLLTIEEFDNYILITTLNTKSSLILKKIFKSF